MKRISTIWQENRSLMIMCAVLLGVAVILAALAVMFFFRLHFLHFKTKELQIQLQEARTRYGADPEAVLARQQRLVDHMRQWYDSQLAARSAAEEVEAQQPLAFKQQLLDVSLRLSTMAQKHAASVPPYFGFDEYAVRVPEPHAFADLSKKLSTVEKLVILMISNGAKIINAIQFAGDEQQDAGNQSGGKKGKIKETVSAAESEASFGKVTMSLSLETTSETAVKIIGALSVSETAYIIEKFEISPAKAPGVFSLMMNIAYID